MGCGGSTGGFGFEDERTKAIALIRRDIADYFVEKVIPFDSNVKVRPDSKILALLDTSKVGFNGDGPEFMDFISQKYNIPFNRLAEYANRDDVNSLTVARAAELIYDAINQQRRAA